MKKKYYIVYRTDNLVNGKYYHGCHQTYNLDDGYLGSGTLLLRAVKKYGKDSFKRTIISFYDSRELMLEAEKLHVNHTDPMSYNLQEGGTPGNDSIGLCRAEITDETRKKLSEAGKGRVFSPETRRKMSEARKNIILPPVTEEARRKMSEALKGRVFSPEHCKNISDANRGRKFSKSHKAKLTEARHARPPPSEETRKKLSDAGKGYVKSPEHRRRLAESNKNNVVSEKTKAKIRATLLAHNERKRNEKIRDELPDQTGSFHFSYGDELGDDFLTMDTSLKSHLDDDTTYKIPKPITMRLACGTST